MSFATWIAASMVVDSAADKTQVEIGTEDLLHIWWAVSGMLVLVMQVGFICLEMGSVRQHNRTGIAVKNFVLLLVSTLAYSLIGFRLMYGDSIGGVIGNPIEIATALENGPEWLFLQLGFASVAATIISGALAGRSSLQSNAIFAFVVAGFLYPVFGHWVWSDGGWLREHYQVQDFAGSGVVHLMGGAVALIAAYVLGPRIDLKNEDGSFKSQLGPRALPLATVGVVFLWIGWIGFNGGSVNLDHFATQSVNAATETTTTASGNAAFASEFSSPRVPKTIDGSDELAADSDKKAPPGFTLIGHAIMSTSLAAGAGGLSALLLAFIYQRWFGNGRGLDLARFLSENVGFDPYATLSGAMGGMVAVTANCAWVYDNRFIACAIGAAGGLISFVTSIWIKKRFDDPVDAIAVHAGAGALGFFLAGFHRDELGFLNFGGQLLAIGSALALATVVIYPLAKFLNWLDLFRVTMEEESDGLSWEPPVKVITPHRALITHTESTERRVEVKS